MIVQTKVGERTFHVEILDVRAQPVVAIVDGEKIEVWLEGEPSGTLDALIPQTALNEPPAERRQGEGTRMVAAPIPGVIVSLSVQAGSAVERGQELCVLEAMKMKNPIRAPRAGTIAVVHVVAGQQVGHRDPLFEYAG